MLLIATKTAASSVLDREDPIRKDQCSTMAKPGVSFSCTFGPHMAATVHLRGHRIQSDPVKPRKK